jgi:AcrR family transcriptional regulator
VTDGRALRRLRNEDAVVDAILDLLNEGIAQPTAQQVAARSGVSIRSIFRIFQDVDALHATAVTRQLARIEPLLVALPTTGPMAERIRALVDNRAVVFDTVSPVRRLAVRLAPTSPVIAGELARASRFFRKQVATVFAPELGGKRSSERLEAIDAVTSWETWERLRRGQGRSTAQAKQIVRRLVSAVLDDGDNDEGDR